MNRTRARLVLVDTSPGYREYAPPARLAAAVSCTWLRVEPVTGGPPTRVLPDGCVDLIWESGRGVYVAGPDTGPVLAATPPGAVLAGVRLRPGAGGPALGIPLSALLDQRVDIGDLRSDLLASPGAALDRQLPGSLPPGAAMRGLTSIAARMVAAAPPDPLVAEAAQRLGRPGSRVHRVAAELGISQRQLQRRCCAAVGYGPVMLSRVLRFRRFVSRVDAGQRQPGDLACLAAEAGYADQAHLTRESNQLAGLPPAALARARHALPVSAEDEPATPGTAGR
ncbi:MAG TPA: helix-turn-helix domain-containing protein [Streptosporangiaceae bacterium]|nr:helix-turn-helix domain-containing protein [Streptosporangiaceae bacterium]